jgi:hypothetical protein
MTQADPKDQKSGNSNMECKDNVETWKNERNCQWEKKRMTKNEMAV